MSNRQSGNLNPIELQRNLKGVDYPAGKREIIEKARENGAEDRIIQHLEQLPDETFERPTDITAALSEAM